MFKHQVRIVTLVFALACAAQAAQAATIATLSDNFDSPTINASNWTVGAADFETGTGTFSANTTTNAGSLTLSGTTTSGGPAVGTYWGGTMLNSVDTFASDQVTAIKVDRNSMTGSGTGWRSVLWLKQTDGDFVMLNHNSETNPDTWRYATVPGNTGTGILNDNGTGNREMLMLYRPQGGNNAAVDFYIDGVLRGSTNLSNWENNVDFNIRLAAMARATNDTVNATFDNFAAKTVTLLDTPTATGTNATTAFVVSSTDLLEGLLPTVQGTLNGNEGTSTNPAVLTNGTFGAANKNGNPGEVLTIGNNTMLTYQLDLNAAPDGYDITSIQTYAGWNDEGRDDQDYTVLLSFVDDPDFFLPLATVDHHNGTPASIFPSDTEVVLSAADGLIASGVAGVRFAFGTDVELNYVGYREFDVFGAPTLIATENVPEPNTFSMWMIMSLACIGFVAALRRRRAR